MLFPRNYTPPWPSHAKCQNLFRAGLFITRFYPKVCELRQFQITKKQCNLRANTMFKTFTSLHNVYQKITKQTK